MSAGTTKPWGKRIGIAIAVMLVIAVGGGGLYKLRYPSNPNNKRKRVVTKDRQSWVAKDKITLPQVGPSPTPECEEMVSATEEMIRFLKHACNQGEGEVDACRHLYYSSLEDSAEENPEKEYYQKAAIRAYAPKCNKGSGNIDDCEQLYNALPESSVAQNQAWEYRQKAAIRTYAYTCDHGLGDPKACRNLYNALPHGSDEQKQAEEYWQKAGANRCNKGSGDPISCGELYDASSQDSAEREKTWKYWQKAAITTYSLKCNKESEDPDDCRMHAAAPWSFMKEKRVQAWEYWLKASMKRCMNKNELEHCQRILEQTTLGQVARFKQVADKLLKACLIEQEYSACSPVIDHYRRTQPQCLKGLLH